MYYEEKIVSGVLCHRSDPHGPWVPFTIESLSIAFVAMKRQYEQEKERSAEFKRRNVNALSALSGLTPVAADVLSCAVHRITFDSAHG